MRKWRAATSGYSLLPAVLDGDHRRRLGEPVASPTPDIRSALRTHRVPTREGRSRPSTASVRERQVLDGHLLCTGEALQDRGNTEPRVHRFAPDPGCDTDGVDPVHHDLRATGLGHEQRARDLHVEDGQRSAVTLPQIRTEIPYGHQHRPGKQEVPMGVHDALGPTGRATGVGDPGRVGGSAGSAGGSWPGCCRPCPARNRRHLRPRWSAVSSGRRTLSEAIRDVGGGQEEASLGIAKDEALLRRRQVAIDPQPDRTQSRHRVKRDDDVARIRQADGDDVVLPDPHGCERAGRPFDFPVELLVRQPGVGADQGLVGGIALERPLQHIAD